MLLSPFHTVVSTSTHLSNDQKGEERPVKTPSKEPEILIIPILKRLHKGVQSKVKGRLREELQTFYVVWPIPEDTSAVCWSPTYLGLSVLDGDLFLGAARMFCIARTRRRRTVLLSL